MSPGAGSHPAGGPRPADGRRGFLDGEARGRRGRPDTDAGRSYYGQPVLNPPTWAALDIAGYLFLGGLAGGSSALAAATEAKGIEGLGRPLRMGAAGAIGLSLVALVHDLGRPGRFYNMWRVFKPSSPMSVGSWILSVYGPAAIAAAVLDVVPLPGPLASARRPLQKAASVTAGLIGPVVTTYTGVLVADTAVPAWHGGYREMPFLFAGSAGSASGGLGLLTVPPMRAAPARRLAVTGAVAELTALRVMKARMGLPAETYDQGRAGRLMKAAETLTVAGTTGAVVGRRSRLASAAAGACLLAGSALTRFGVFQAGVQSAEDPRYTVEPQRARLAARPGSPSA